MKQEIEYMSSVTNTKRKAIVLLPEDYNKDDLYPVLYLLHGIGGDETEWLNANPEDMNNKNITVLVNARARANDKANPEDIFTIEHYKAFDSFREELLNDLMPYMEAHYNIKTDRENTSIAGLSMGGREALYIGLTKQDMFGNIGAFTPAFGLLPYTYNGVTEDGLLDRESFKLKTEYFNNTKILITAGKSDMVVLDEPERYHMFLDGNLTPHEFLYMDGGHDFDVWSKSLEMFIS